MKMKTTLLCLILLSACTPAYDPGNPKDFIRPMKYCVDECLKRTFKVFHAKGESWGTGSSSMAGPTQTEVFDRVLKHCKDFLEGEQCCEQASFPFGDKWSGYVHKSNLPTGYYSGSYGPCQEVK